MGTPSPPGGCPSGPGGVCKEGARPLTVARSPGQADLGGDRATGLSGSPRSRHCSPLVLQAPHCTPCTSRCHQGVPDSSDGFPHAPGSSLTSHPAPARSGSTQTIGSGTAAEKHTRKIKIWPFLKLA